MVGVGCGLADIAQRWVLGMLERFPSYNGHFSFGAGEVPFWVVHLSRFEISTIPDNWYSAGMSVEGFCECG